MLRVGDDAKIERIGKAGFSDQGKSRKIDAVTDQKGGIINGDIFIKQMVDAVVVDPDIVVNKRSSISI